MHKISKLKNVESVDNYPKSIQNNAFSVDNSVDIVDIYIHFVHMKILLAFFMKKD